MTAKSYPQLDEEALELMRRRLDYHDGSRAALAREIGVSRAAVSQALDGKYPSGTGKLRARVIEALAEMVKCPHLGAALAPGVCKAARERKLSTVSDPVPTSSTGRHARTAATTRRAARPRRNPCRSPFQRRRPMPPLSDGLAVLSQLFDDADLRGEGLS
ncbi:MAG: hypothetical protein HZY79_00545 [Rhodoblastus sp.]|nr:MAG: hypothetical protein HZY79_00545 [Rhodoblastus sp.]